MAGLTPPRPLTADDDRQAFDCGRESLNQWFRRRAWANQEANVSRTSVICARETGCVAGFVSLSAAHIERAFVAKSDQRNRPDPLPAMLLGQLGVDRHYQGLGCARSLILFALESVVRFSEEVGCFCVLTHPLDEEVRAFYRAFGFSELPYDPRRSMAVRIVDLTRSGFGRLRSSS